MFGHTRVLLWLCLWKYDSIIVFLSALTMSERKITFRYILNMLMICFNSMVVGCTLLITTMMMISCSLYLFSCIAFLQNVIIFNLSNAIISYWSHAISVYSLQAWFWSGSFSIPSWTWYVSIIFLLNSRLFTGESSS